MIDNIPEVSYMDITAFPKEMHIGYVKNVKSTIVGNHLYQTSNGWTWERLIEEGKALLAVDPETDRIVSTDKKAEKAGGLILALLGQPVGPDDDVDVTKEYELIAPPSES